MPKLSHIPTVTNPVYETKDWIEASVLMMNDLPIRSIRRINRTIWFAFPDKVRALELVGSYWSGTLQGNIRSFADAQRRVKDIVHNHNSNGIFSDASTPIPS